jgi:hypothetical protein
MKKSPFDNSQALTTLIDELMKESPNQTLVRKLMVQHGIPYSLDPITQMGTVLNLMDQGTTVKRLRKGESEI